jgi:murein DD-endopeptidase MepM/ murein hydrolase activator NlpD
MGRDRKVWPHQPAKAVVGLKTGLRSDSDQASSPLQAAVSPPPTRERPSIGGSTHPPTHSNGNGRIPHDNEADETTGTLDPPFWVPENVDAPPEPPVTTPRRHSPPPDPRASRQRLLLHSLVLSIIVAVVLGHGYWGHTQAMVAHPGGVDTLGDLSQVPLPTGQSLTSGMTTQTLVAPPPSGDVMTGFVSGFASAVIPEQLHLQVVTAEEGQTITSIAAETGRSVETLLWANGLTDPSKLLAGGTQVRVPPVDGMLHVVRDGDTLESIAARYQVKVSDITGYSANNVQTSADLVPYRMLMVPGSKMPMRDRVVTYTVREGDSLSNVAELFGLNPDTIIWANSLPNGNMIFPGQHLAILPTDGVMVTVQAGDTVESLAKHWGVEPSAIRDYPQNALGGGVQLQVGQQIMILGGHPPPPPPAPEPTPAPAANPAPAAPAPPPPTSGGATGRFIWPTSGVITQYFGPSSLWMEPAYNGYAHFHQGLDIADAMYTPIVAADGGVVVFAGWNTFGFGYAVAIDHGGGLVTWYGHMAEQPAVSVGQSVSQGQHIGPMGSTGASTGSHLHFAVMKDGAWVDPLHYLQ